MDLLVPGVGEIIGGSQREERMDILNARIQELGMDMQNYWWYMDMRKFGGVKHAGYGLGFERMIMYLKMCIRDRLQPMCWIASILLQLPMGACLL